jgi:hypothetical protein
MNNSPYPTGSYCENYDLELVNKTHRTNMQSIRIKTPENTENLTQQEVIIKLQDANNKYLSALTDAHNSNTLYLNEIHRLNQEINTLQNYILLIHKSSKVN